MKLRHSATLLVLAQLAAHDAGRTFAKETAKKGGDPKPRFELAAVATPPEKIRVPEGFKVELLYSVPKDQEGSWVNICYDPKGRLIVSDQYGGLYRVTPPTSSQKLQIEKIPAEIGTAHGLLWAFDSLYVMVNSGDHTKNGLYRVRDTNGDDQLDSVELLHGLMATANTARTPCCPRRMANRCTSSAATTRGRSTAQPRVSRRSGTKTNCCRGSTASASCAACPPRPAPSTRSIQTARNGSASPAAFAIRSTSRSTPTASCSRSTPTWSGTSARPGIARRACATRERRRLGLAKRQRQVARRIMPIRCRRSSTSASARRPEFTFGYGAKFPAKYQNALFICDWTYGKMFAVHLQPQGASYTGDAEEFMTATPLPLTDAIINPHDGAMYFLIGGRKTQSGLYRLTYAGKESTAPASAHQPNADDRKLRHELEALHIGEHADAVDKAWPNLKSPDRFIRYAARTALEHQPLETWQERALTEERSASVAHGALGARAKNSALVQADGTGSRYAPS